MLSQSNIQGAILAMNSPEDHNDSIELLNSWTQQPESILTALDLIMESEHENVKAVCSAFLKYSIIDFWNQTDPSLKPNFRKRIINYALSYENKDQILKNISAIIAHIAIFDWPDEWPDLTSIIISTVERSNIFYYNSLKIFQKLVKDIQRSENITELRRIALINLFIEQITDIFEYLTNFLGVPLFAKASLKTMSYLLLWIPNYETILPPIFEQILTNFLSNEDTCTASLKCLSSIFISRSDSSTTISKYGPFLIHTISNSTFSGVKPITSNKSVIEFIIQFLNYYMISFELVLVIDQVREEPQLSLLIDDSINELHETLTSSKEMSIVDFKNDLIQLFQVILSIQVEDIKDDFWHLWFNILKQVRYELTCKFKINPANEFFQPMLPVVLQTLYDALPSAINEESIFTYQTRVCISSLFFIDQESFIQFVNSQQMSVNLCYLIGILEFVLDSNDATRSLSRIVIELIESLDKLTDSQFVVALLFCLTHSSVFFQKNNNLFEKFIEFIIACFNDEDTDVNDAACNALSYIVNNRVGLFSGESKQFTESIVEQSEKFFYNMNQQASFSIFKTCTKLICQNDQVSNSKELFQSLLEPVMNFLSDFLKQIKQIIQEKGNLIEFQSCENKIFERVEFAVSIINECTNCSYFAATKFFDLVWPTLFELTNIVIENSEFDSDLVSTLLNAIAWIQVNLNPQEIDEIDLMKQIFDSMISRGSIDESIFDYISIIKEHIEDDSESIENLYPFIHQNFIEPSLNVDEQSDVPLRGILRMVTLFNPKSIDIQWITSIAINGIRDLRTDVNTHAIKCLNHVISNVSNEQFSEFTDNFENSVVFAVIEGITDRIHKNSIPKYIEFLRSFANVVSSDQEKNGLKPDIMNSLQKCANEPSDGFFENFTNYILSIKKMYVQFKEAFLDLLIVLKKSTPSDYRLFEIEPVHQNIIIDEMINSVKVR